MILTKWGENVSTFANWARFFWVTVPRIFIRKWVKLWFLLIKCKRPSVLFLNPWKSNLTLLVNFLESPLVGFWIRRLDFGYKVFSWIAILLFILFWIVKSIGSQNSIFFGIIDFILSFLWDRERDSWMLGFKFKYGDINYWYYLIYFLFIEFSGRQILQNTLAFWESKSRFQTDVCMQIYNNRHDN